MNPTYSPQETKLFESVGLNAPTFTGSSLAVSDVTTLVVTLLLMIIGGAAFYRYMMAGIYRLEASESGVRRSNEAFKGATLGLLGVFLLFFIFFTLNADFLLNNISLSTLRVPQASTSAGTAAGGSGTASSTAGSQSTSTSSAALPTGACVRKTCTAADLPRITGSADSSVRSTLKGSGVDINVPNGCTTIGQGGCTNVGGMPQEVISMLASLKSACGCRVVVSGGTEWWAHSTHGPGVMVVDLQIPRGSGGAPNLSDSLYVFISSQAKIGGSSNCHSSYSWNGWNFCDEKTGATALSTSRHWHVKRQ